MKTHSTRSWLAQLFGAVARERSVTRPAPSHRLRLEGLEERCVPTTVTTLTDNVVGSLRAAIVATPANGTISFAPGLSGTMTLTAGELVLPKNLTITGPGANLVKIDAHGASRVFDLTASSITVSISGLTLTRAF